MADLISWLVPPLHHLKVADARPPIYLSKVMSHDAEIEYVTMPASHVTAEWVYLRHLKMLTLTPTFNYPDIHDSEPPLPLGSLRLVCESSLLCPKPEREMRCCNSSWPNLPSFELCV